MYYILIDDPAHSARIAKAIDALFANSTAQTKTETSQAFAVGFLAQLGNIKMFLIGISGGGDVYRSAGFGQHHGDVGAGTGARGRHSQDAGLHPGSILGMILGEACAISIAGGAIGYLISTLLMHGVAKSPFGPYLTVHAFEPRWLWPAW